MEEKIKHIAIVDSGNDEASLLALKIAELKSTHPGLEVITLDEAKERAQKETFVIKARHPLPIEPIVVKNTRYGFESTGQSRRAARRKAERESKIKPHRSNQINTT